MTCPFCNNPMTPGFVQARGEVYFTEKPHKLMFAAKGNDIRADTAQQHCADLHGISLPCMQESGDRVRGLSCYFCCNPVADRCSTRQSSRSSLCAVLRFCPLPKLRIMPSYAHFAKDCVKSPRGTMPPGPLCLSGSVLPFPLPS
jgi:hypothetical protein